MLCDRESVRESKKETYYSTFNIAVFILVVLDLLAVMKLNLKFYRCEMSQIIHEKIRVCTSVKIWVIYKVVSEI